MVPHVYILRCSDGTLYTGSAKDLGARVKRHNQGKASRYTRARLPVDIAWTCECSTWSASLKKEIQIKKLTRHQKLALIKNG